jgi:hypothetical protein
VLSGLACPGPGPLVRGCGPVCGACSGALTLSPLVTLPLSVNPCGVASIGLSPFVFPSLRLPFCYFLSIRAARGGFALLSPALSPFSSVYAPFSSVFRLICSVILSFCLSDSPILSFFFYTIAARLTWAGAPLWAIIAGFSPGRVVRCIMSAFSLACARI